jgi:hypothetical protein
MLSDCISAAACMMIWFWFAAIVKTDFEINCRILPVQPPLVMYKKGLGLFKKHCALHEYFWFWGRGFDF